MEFERITVRTRDDFRGAQEPTGFAWRGIDFEVVRIEDRWYEGSMSPTRLPMRYFRVLTRGGERFILRYHEGFDAWSLLIASDRREA